MNKSRWSISLALLTFSGMLWAMGATDALAQNTVIRVSAEGTGDFATIQAAVDSVPNNNTSPFVIKIAPGTYSERVDIRRGKNHVALIGTGATRTATILTTGHVDIDSASEKCALSVHSDDTWVENLTVENTAGPTAGPHGALYTDGKRQIFENLLIKGWQDTLPIWGWFVELLSQLRCVGKCRFRLQRRNRCPPGLRYYSDSLAGRTAGCPQHSEAVGIRIGIPRLPGGSRIGRRAELY